MTNTINNVPRELLENLIEQHITAHGCTTETARQAQLMLSAPSPADHVEDVRAMVADPSPAGVDVLKRYEVFPYLDDEVAELDICESDDGTFVKYDAAKAIIDGLRAEVGAQRAKTCAALKARNDAHEERDHLAQCLKFARTTMAVVANNANLRGVEHRSLISEVKRIDAALSEVDK